jgi:hypothetical protein
MISWIICVNGFKFRKSPSGEGRNELVWTLGMQVVIYPTIFEKNIEIAYKLLGKGLLFACLN